MSTELAHALDEVVYRIQTIKTILDDKNRCFKFEQMSPTTKPPATSICTLSRCAAVYATLELVPCTATPKHFKGTMFDTGAVRAISESVLQFSAFRTFTEIQYFQVLTKEKVLVCFKIG